MKLILLLWQRELTAIKRNGFQIILLITILMLGMYSLYYGYSKINLQRKVIDEVEAIQTEEFDRYLSSFHTNNSSLEEKQLQDIASKPGFAWYRHGYHAILHPHSLAHLSLGQRDLEPYYYRLTGMSLYYQLFENELANPVKLFVGNFDLAFVLVYLFPLVIITLCYGLYADEKENGTLALLRIQPHSIRKIMQVRLLFYYILVTGMACILSIIGFVIAPYVEIVACLLWLLVLLGYFGFWFAIIYMLISFKLNSSLTAMLSAGLWLFFLIIFPAVLNLYAKITFPVDSASLADITRRRSLENEEDIEEAKAVITEYLEEENGMQEAYNMLDENTMAKAYAAFTVLNDRHHEKEVKAYFNQIQSREEWISRIRWANPAINTQALFNKICRTGASTFQDFYTSVKLFHEHIKTFYFDKLFLGKNLNRGDYKKLPKFQTISIHNGKISQGIMYGCGLILVISLVIFLLGSIIFKHSKI